MSEHDENVSVEVDSAQEAPAETPAQKDAVQPEEGVHTPAEETPKESSDEESTQQSPVEPADEAATTVDGGKGSDDLFLDPDEEGGEEIEDVPDVASLQGELDEAKAQSDALQADLDAMTAERDDFKSRLLRSAADMENFRKRKDRERDELRKYGSDKVVGDLLPAIDNLERALEHAEKSEEQSSIADGVKMVQRQLITALEKHGVKSFTAVGERFDPQLHEAIQQVETTEFDTGVVVQEFQKGYYIHDRLLRASMTVVAKNVAPPKPELVEDVPSEEEPPTEQLPEDDISTGEPVIDMGGSSASLEEGSEAGS